MEEWTQRSNITRFQVGGRESHGPRNVSSLQMLEKESKQIFSQCLLKGIQSCQDLVFNPMNPCLTSDLQSCKIINLYCFKPTHLWSFVTAAIRNQYNTLCNSDWSILHCVVPLSRYYTGQNLSHQTVSSNLGSCLIPLQYSQCLTHISGKQKMFME